MIHKKYMNNTGMLDILFCMLFFFFILTVLEAAFIAVADKKPSVQQKAEYVITIEWPAEMEDDVDTYLEDPYGNLIHYRQKAAGLMHLDRDDLGHSNDTIRTPHGDFKYDKNREIVTLRGFIPGEYTLNIHLYSKRSGRPVPVKITIEKINPWTLVWQKEVVLENNGDEKTVTRFTIDDKGAITGYNDLEKRFIGNRIGGI